MRTRRDVWKLSQDSKDKTLYWYAVAVEEMQGRLFNNPLSWKFQAAVHGYQAALYPPMRAGEKPPTPTVQKRYWQQCEHSSWYFFPWHRIYIFIFEQICREVILSHKGPEDWALPYWNYSHPSTARERTLPDAFRNSSVGGATNPLYVQRGPGVNRGGVVGTDKQVENVTCLKSGVFSGTVPSGFGGGISKPMQFSKSAGNCENEPHNTMHDAIGGLTEWMGNPRTAALDPIFWIHHANIDRLWVMWEKDPHHVPPPDPVWNKQKFDFFDSKGNPKRYAVKEVLQTTGPLCDYVYEDTTIPGGIPVAPPPVGKTKPLLEALAMNALTKSQAIGGSPNVTLGDGEASVSFALHNPAPIADIGKQALAQMEFEAPQPRVHLALENVTAQEHPIHTYEVYLDVPTNDAPQNHPELMAGLIPRFGLVEASQADEAHGGDGVNLSFDITEIVSRLQRKEAWDPNNVRVTFAPHDTHEDELMKLEGRAVPGRQPVKVGKVTVYTQSGT